MACFTGFHDAPYERIWNDPGQQCVYIPDPATFRLWPFHVTKLTIDAHEVV